MRILMAGLAVLPLQGCDALDRLLSVEPQDRAPASAIESSPANAKLLANSAVADFDCAFGAYVVIGGLIGEELDDTRPNIIDRKAYDQRVHTSKDRVYAVRGCESMGVYTPLQTARVSAERALRLLESWSDAEVPQRATLIARMHAYAGYSTLLLGEGFCTTVLSPLDAKLEVVYGGEISRDSAFKVADARLGAAITAAEAVGVDASDLLNLALVGRARARLDRGDLTGARSDAMRVPQAFFYEMTASATSERRNNRVWALERTDRLTSVGVLYRSLGDPRVPLINARGPTGASISQQNKYPSASSPIRIASGAEAQLIIAEVDIAAGTASSLQNAAAVVNTFRARGNQPPLSIADQTTLRAALIDQRRRELFLEGQHLGDIIRFDVTLTPAAGTRFPGGGVYGSQKCLFLPDVERRNNPALHG